MLRHDHRDWHLWKTLRIRLIKYGEQEQKYSKPSPAPNCIQSIQYHHTLGEYNGQISSSGYLGHADFIAGLLVFNMHLPSMK